MRVLFIAEGNKKIGLGAFYNCLALAKGFKERFGSKIKFLISPDSETNIENLLLNGYDVERVDMRDTEIFLSSIKGFKPDTIVQDILDLKEDYMEGLNRLKATVVDIAHSPDFKNRLKTNLVINLLYDSKKVRCLYGPKYAILDDRFKNLDKKEIKDIAGDLLISFGGSDVNNLTLKLMRALDRLELDFEVKVVIGPGFGEEDRLQEYLNGLVNKKRFIIHKEVTDMLSLISGSDLAFVSGGRTIYELAVTGTPGIGFAQNELEYARLKEFEKWGSLLNYGYFKDNHERLLTDIKEVILNKALRKKMSERGQGLVDGRGVDRIIDVVSGIKK